MPTLALNQPVDLTLRSSVSINAAACEYCLDTVNNDACGASWTDVGLVTSTQVTGLSEWTAYFWQVRAVNGYGSAEANGGVWWSFVTTPYLFADGLESGDTSAWSATVP